MNEVKNDIKNNEKPDTPHEPKPIAEGKAESGDAEGSKAKEGKVKEDKAEKNTTEESKAIESQAEKETTEQQPVSPEETLKEAIAKQAIEEEAPQSANQTLRKILGGDILNAQIIRRQIWLIMLVVFFVIIYISNRYNIQKDLIELDQLQNTLQDAKYRALSSSSQITEKSRESNVLEMLKNNKDSSLHIATQPPYIINVPEEQ